MDSADGGQVAGATCLYAVYDPATGHCMMARAGHPEPMLTWPDGTVSQLELPTGPPLGVGGLTFEGAEYELPEGSRLALYTDGLIETTGRDVDTALAELREVLGRPALSLEQTCDAVMDALVPEQPEDDIALVLARTRRLDAYHYAAWDFPADPAVVSHARKRAAVQLAAWGLDDAVFTTELVVSELVTNAIRYGGDPIRLRLIRDTALICEVFDGSSTAPICAAPASMTKADAACCSSRVSPSAGAPATPARARPSGPNSRCRTPRTTWSETGGGWGLRRIRPPGPGRSGTRLPRRAGRPGRPGTSSRTRCRTRGRGSRCPPRPWWLRHRRSRRGASR